MRWSRSLRFRLLAGAAVWIALALTLAGGILSDLFREHVQTRFAAELTTHLDQLAAALETGADGAPALPRPLSDPRFRRPLSGLYWQVEDGGRPVLRSRSLWDVTLALPPDALADGEIHRHRIAGPDGQSLLALERMVFLPDAAEPVRIAVAGDEAETAAARASFDRTLALSLAVLGVALIGAVLVQVAVGLRPLARLRRELAAIRAGQRRRLSGDVPEEVRPLAEDLNAVLDHGEEVVARARVQAGNLAHALKTDLAVLANDARDPASGGGERIVRRLERMTRAIDHHMARARAAAAHGVPGVRTEVTPVIERLVRTLSRLHAGRVLAFAVDCAPGLVFAGERQDLEEMLGNLLDNACKWADTRVRVTVAPDPAAGLVVTVEDDGPGLAPGQRAAVLAPGVRLDEAVPGSGLGLAVVTDVAGLYGGTLALEDSALGGLKATVRLPAAD
ncbi:sensor histidine kinase [Azospirillum halopraeferens]|uniref:sensor histidine kinase n=1 Tax=Azospirillum halopraeferens TaxID=34010 RepID=UPI00041DE493|nr:sensor histidine kinase [Azospirillum halopraeferens]